jgi:hypothetical protein
VGEMINKKKAVEGSVPRLKMMIINVAEVLIRMFTFK